MRPIVTVLYSAGLGMSLVSSVIDSPRVAGEASVATQSPNSTGTPAGNPSWASLQVLFNTQLDSLLWAIDSLESRVRNGRTVAAQRAFRQARTAYKRVEGLLAYYAPATVTMLQGPLESEGEGDIAPRPYNMPGAFPTVESALFPKLTPSSSTLALNRIRAMHERVAVLRSATESLDIDEAAVFDAGRAEIARVSTLDIAGFDSDREDDALLDAAAALDGVRSTLIPPDEPESDSAMVMRQKADAALKEAAGYLSGNPSFERMDRLTFIARYSVPASHAWAALRSARSIPLSVARAPRLWRDDAPSVYDSGAFDPTAYAGRFRLTADAAGRITALGARLFSDPRLSGPGTRSCATCHVPGKAFTDGLPKRMSLVLRTKEVAEGAPPPRHTPMLINVALEPALFDDERARTLEQQVAMVLANPDEMGSSTDTAVRRLAADSSYREAFARAFGGPPDRAVTSIALQIAIATYERSLLALNSRFDRAARGDTTAMTAAERRGFTLYMGKARCGTCHFAPLFNGALPPLYLSTDPEIIGVPEHPALRQARLDPDPGRGAVDLAESHRFAFKVPTVRNAALSAPYMHNGAFKSLEEVIAFYNAGGGAGIGINLPHQTLFTEPLGLTPGERSDLIGFLRALTDASVVPVPNSFTFH
jgi:cytochrome c peroxidase